MSSAHPQSSSCSPAGPEVLFRLPLHDARALDALLLQLDVLNREISHARETAARRGDDASQERVLDLECEHHCQSERLAEMMSKRIAATVHRTMRDVVA